MDLRQRGGVQRMLDRPSHRRNEIGEPVRVLNGVVVENSDLVRPFPLESTAQIPDEEEFQPGASRSCRFVGTRPSQAASPWISQGGWNSATAVEGATVKRR